MDEALRINANLSLPAEAIEEKFVRSSGPGGQNVNKVSTAVQLSVDTSALGLEPEVLERLRRLAGSRLTVEGRIAIKAQSARTQEANRKAARRALVELVKAALVPPKRRKKTKTPKSSKEKRLDSKRRRARTKEGRGSVDHET